MKIVFDRDKEDRNRVKHKLSLRLAAYVLADPLVAIIYDRFEGGEHRYHAVGVVGGKCLVVVHSYPDPADDSLIRVISLRQATTQERKRYERQ